MGVLLNGERLEKVLFNVLGTLHKNGRMKEEIGHRMREREKAGGTTRAVWRNTVSRFQWRQ